MLKINFSLRIISLCLYFWFIGLLGYSQINNDYFRLIDSADIHVDTDSEKTLSFLEAIPKPLEEFIPGRVAEYYSLKALVHDDFDEYTKYHQCCILAIKYAEKENTFCIAGEASVGLFSNLYFIGNINDAYKYLKKARDYYEKCDYKYGDVEVLQAEAYAKFLDGDYIGCNTFLLKELKNYKNIKDDAYYYMFALYMLSSNYIYLDDLKKAHKYYHEFKSLKNDTTITKYNYFSFEGAIQTCFADIYLKDKDIDSTSFYLESSSKLTKYMSEDALEDYYGLHADLNKYLGNIENSKIYIDSMVFLNNKIHSKTIEASFDVNDSLDKAESELISQNRKKAFNRFLAVTIVVFLVLLSLLLYIHFKRQKNKLVNYNQETNTSLSYLKTNNEQLAVKVHGLEAYIKNLKKEVKQISRTECINHQKEQIKDLYKNLHINSSTLLDKSESHLDIMNELNVEFFKKIEEVHPELNKSEIIICYYLFMGFTNKEIAVFLNTTIRSVESRRYRISKKIHLVKTDTTLLEYLENTFSYTLKNGLNH